MEIKNKVALVTGGASGLGEACVRMFINAGAKAAIVDMDTEKGSRLAEELGDNVCFCPADVTDAESTKAAIAKAVQVFGHLQIVVNCAGVGAPAKVLGKDGPMSLDLFTRVVQINLIGTINVIRLAAEKMVTNEPDAGGEKGVVINTASAAAFEGQIGQAAYSASKAGVVGMTLPIAREFAAYGIRVVTIAPGLFETPMLAALPQKAKAALANMMPFPKRLGYPHEFAQLAGQIVTNPMLNGETIRLDAALRMTAK